MKKAQGSLEYSAMIALILVMILVAVFYFGEGVVPKAIKSTQQNEILQYQNTVEVIKSNYEATGAWNSLKNETISCSNSQCTFNGETKSIDDPAFSYSDTLENAYNKCIYENDINSCKAIVYVLGE
ncbi:class III signal peptide-containing protein [Thermococcus argininiproducens]|uniref:Class III signal peptide-containing protein n=1 Tax=Thermococcus argininiproducens TaxID=2866384 RepID=A0A9E7MAA1_9EURY|nr:class III signal peptide-containing protein [Thermococcus argininiproducens]USH00347.1 class III signal peptide-containing protein [Thermococcus argininiproducens]